jgi:hypothetical protein
VVKIVSGGQTGVDRAALDAALAIGAEVGGWCPEGRTAEDGSISGLYPLTELLGAGYPERTRQNVTGSDATVIIYFGHPSGGTELTIQYCSEENRPYLLLDAEEIEAQIGIARLLDFVKLNAIDTLNVAGPRASSEPRAYSYAREVIQGFLKLDGAIPD